jgi:hypothetical protein
MKIISRSQREKQDLPIRSKTKTYKNTNKLIFWCVNYAFAWLLSKFIGSPFINCSFNKIEQFMRWKVYNYQFSI